jgi:hypothetical protein
MWAVPSTAAAMYFVEWQKKFLSYVSLHVIKFHVEKAVRENIFLELPSDISPS